VAARNAITTLKHVTVGCMRHLLVSNRRKSGTDDFKLHGGFEWKLVFAQEHKMNLCDWQTDRHAASATEVACMDTVGRWTDDGAIELY